MATNDKSLTWLDRIKAALKTKDEAAVARVVDEAEAELSEEEKKRKREAAGDGGEETHVHVHTGDEALAGRLTKVEDTLTTVLDKLTTLDAKLKTRDEDPDSEEEKERGRKPAAASAADSEAEKELEEETGSKDARMAKDSAMLADSFQETVAAAEILMPGIRIPTFDRASNPKQTLDAICRLRKQALDLAYHTPDGRPLIEEIHGKPLVLDGMSCAAARTLFRAAVAAKRATNNASTHDMSVRQTSAGAPVGGVRSIAELNKLNAERYKQP